MQYTPTIPYPNNEKPKLDLLKNLFSEWHLHFFNNVSTLKKHGADDMVFDGFYPHYFSQNPKRILFVAWESVGIDGQNYIDLLYQCYRKKSIGGRPINQYKFHNLLMYLAYGISNGFPAWNDLPKASEICDTFGDLGGLSFAFMNISKLSNVTTKADHPVIGAAYDLSTRPRNFIQEELLILEPDIVITMNLGDKLASLGQLEKICLSKHADSYWLETDGHRSLLIDAWHFAARAKRSESDYYIPICDAIMAATPIID